MKYLLLSAAVLFSFFFACTRHAPPVRGEAQLVVTYNGKEVHRRNTGWVSKEELNAIVETPGKKIFIFGAPWCKPCGLLRTAIKQANVKHEIYWVNIDEPLGQELMVVMGKRSIPLMMATGPNGEFIAERVGPAKITMYLLLN